MGAYILNSVLPVEHAPTGKVQTLIDRYGARQIDRPAAFPPPEGKAWVNVVNNYTFEGALVITSPREFHRCISDDSGRPQTWLELDKETVRGLMLDREKQRL